MKLRAASSQHPAGSLWGRAAQCFAFLPLAVLTQQSASRSYQPGSGLGRGKSVVSSIAGHQERRLPKSPGKLLAFLIEKTGYGEVLRYKQIQYVLLTDSSV